MGKDVTVYFRGDVSSRVVRIDNDELTFIGDRATKKDVAPGKHYLQWFGEAIPGATYEIGIETPPEAEWGSGKRPVNPIGLYGGTKVFRINKS